MKPLEDCDIADKTELAAYRALRERAHDLLRGDEEHSIFAQLIDFNWRDAIYRIINEARRTVSADRKNAAVAPVLGEFIDQSYVMGVVAAVGRLTDPPSIDSGKGVVSLPTVLRLLRDHHDLVRREMFVCFDGVPYDPTPQEEPWEPGVRWVARTPQDISGDRHALFDRLSRKTPDRRARTDVVHRKVLAAMEDRLAHRAIAGIRRHRNKVVSHAADATSRAGSERFGLSLATVDDAGRALIEVTETLATILTGEILIGMPVPVATFDILEDFSEPFAFDSDLEALQDLWDHTARTREGWSETAVSAVLGR
ncbi:MAG: AbiU2 domain-containing protein [Brevundimonas aurantiaca]|uniref:AbiU2 domain-containing protein n=1 Tax=Brevundimonas aurantiaca TaxID=74316 RepID=UPI002FDE217B